MSFLTDDFKTDLEQHYHLDGIDNVFWSLGHCQGDGVWLDGRIDLQDWRAHEPELHEALCHLEGVAVLSGDVPDADEVFGSVRVKAHHHGWMEMEFDWHCRCYDDDPVDVLYDNVENWVKARVKAIAKEMQAYGYEYIDGESSEERAIEMLRDDPQHVADWKEDL